MREREHTRPRVGRGAEAEGEGKGKSEILSRLYMQCRAQHGLDPTTLSSQPKLQPRVNVQPIEPPGALTK